MYFREMKFKQLFFPILCIFLIFACLENPVKLYKKTANNQYYNALTAAENCKKNNKLDSAFYYYDLSKNIVINDSSNNKPIYSLLMMSEIQQSQNDYVGSENTATEALGYSNKYTNIEYISSLYNLLGMNYDNTFDFELAEKNYNLAIAYSKIDLDKISIKNNIAVVAIDDLKYDKAQKLLSKLISDNSIYKNQNIYAVIIENIGYCLLKKNKENSIAYFVEALALKTKNKQEYQLITNYLHLSEFYHNKNDKLEIQYAKMALRQSEELNCPDEKLKAMEILITKNSGHFSNIYFDLNDSLKKVRQKSKNQFAKIRFDSKKNIAENQLLKTQKVQNDLKISTQRNKILWISIFGIVSFFGGIFVYQKMNYRNKSEKIKTNYQTETRISKKVHDELANDVFNVMTFAITQNLNDETKKEKLISSLDDVYVRTRDISRENNVIETGLYFKDNLKDMLSQFNSQKLNIIINGIDLVNWDKINENKKITVHRVIQELLINVKKHSFATVCVVSFRQFEKKIQIKFSDNGVGMRLEEKYLRNGLQNTENRIQAIKGTITFDTEPMKGFKVKIQFPE